MERYVAQLIKDLHEVTREMNPSLEPCDEAEAALNHEFYLEDMSHADHFLEGEPQPISSITGIAADQLPPAEKLSMAQQALLAEELEKFLQYFHFYLDFPPTYPHYLRYPLIRNVWEQSHVPLIIGKSHIEFCSYVEEQCPFPGYCKVCDEFFQLDTMINDKT